MKMRIAVEKRENFNNDEYGCWTPACDWLYYHYLTVNKGVVKTFLKAPRRTCDVLQYNLPSLE